MKRLVFVLVLLSLSTTATFRAAENRSNTRAPVELFATGLNNPRGLTFGPDGDLYVAEGGLGGAATTTAAQCEQVPAPVGPYSGGFTARISKIDPSGVRTTVAQGLPSSQTSPLLGSLVSGIADVAFVNDELYAIEAAAGCSHGLLNTENAVIKINRNGTTTMVADLSAFQRANPVAHPEQEDFEPDGTWYSMVAVRGDLYAVEPNHGEIDRVDVSTGDVSRVIDVSASQGHIVPTTIAHHGNFFFGNLSLFPIAPGSSSIYKVTPSGQISDMGARADDGSRAHVRQPPPDVCSGIDDRAGIPRTTGIRDRPRDSNRSRPHADHDRDRILLPDGVHDGAGWRAVCVQPGVRRAGPGARPDLSRRGAVITRRKASGPRLKSGT